MTANQDIQKFLLKNSCSSWINTMEKLKSEYREYIEENKQSQYIKGKIKTYTDKQGLTEKQIVNTLSKQYDKLKDFDFNTIENKPLFVINETGRAGKQDINYKTTEDVLKLNLNASNTYIYERIVYDYCRPYFDIDLSEKDEPTDEEIETLISFINEMIEDFKSVNDKTTFTAIGEFKNETVLNYFGNTDIITKIETDNRFKFFENSDKNFKKLLSIHIYVKGVCFDRSVLKDYMKYWVDLYEGQGKTIKGFDCSVYKNDKANQQILRVPYSGKYDESKPRKANAELIKYMNIGNKESVVKNCIVCADNNDIIIPYEPATKAKTTKTIKPDEAEETSVETTTDTKDISIFRFIKSDEQIIDMNTIKDINTFELGQKLCFYLSLSLSFDEFIYELSLIKKDIDADKFASKFDYEQDYTQNFKLRHIMKLNSEQIEKINVELQTPPPNVDELLQLRKDLLYINERLGQYNLKYSKEEFVRRTFYNMIDIKINPEGKKVSKINKLKHNCFITLNDDKKIYYMTENNEIKFYNSRRALRNEFKISGATCDDICDSLTCFESLNELEIMRLDVKYNKLDKNARGVDDLLNMIRQTFKYEEDYKFYIAWLAQKITYKTTNYRSIISQGDNETAYNTLKTYITGLISPFIEVCEADVRNLNKSLNGTYLKGHITVIEELPRNITDLDMFINTLKQYSQIRELTIEEKGEKPYKKRNDTDFIINTNNNVAAMFYRKTDAEALSKRFKILTRKTIDTKKFGDVLDKYNIDDKQHLNAYKFYKYLLNNDELLNYFKEHKNDKSEIEKLYINASVDIDNTDKIETKKNTKQFIDWFIRDFLNKNKELRVKAFTDYLKEHKVYKDIKQNSIRQMLLTNHCAEIKNNHLILTNEHIENIYKKYFYYVESDDLETEEDEVY